ncbi:26S proteasome regulatory complex [Tubulinosema ratisbonensis]|uniref:26S proteasome regulatory complex n=1 Tax=Tubulinosema ratisbonensis TaxID=291195 RepID=A0A437AJ00_9MICR|nr:26S proteasome regulatory complex [Tubulinosema ratisbonensis]
MDNQTLLQELARNQNDSDKKEQTILENISNLIKIKDYNSIFKIISSLSSIWSDISTARISKIAKKSVDSLPKERDDNILYLLTELIDWSGKEGKKMLRLDLEVRKINFLLIFRKFRECLESICVILKDLKRFDDKENQIRLYVYESRAYYELNDISKAKSAMTSARALAVSSYCPTDLQANIDLLSGMFVCDDKLHSVAYSYFLESLDGFTICKNRMGAALSVRYLILSKIMSKKYDEIPVILKNKPIIPYLNDPVLIFFLEIRDACKKRDLKEYQNILQNNPSLLSEDTFVKKHLKELYSILLENNILKIIEPYSNIRINLISEKLNFSLEEIEEKLRKMILDGVIYGIIDNAKHLLIIYEKKTDDKDELMGEILKDLKEIANS